MDKNTIIGFLLIAAILFGFTWLNTPSKEQRELAEKERLYNDSIKKVQEKMTQTEALVSEPIAQKNIQGIEKDSSQVKDIYGVFSTSAQGEEKLLKVENDKFIITFTNKGGRVYSVELKEYQTHDSLPLILFDAEESNFNATFVTNNNRIINTSDMYFQLVKQPIGNNIIKGKEQVVFRLKTTEEAYLDYIYTIDALDYMVDFSIKSHKMNDLLPANANALEMQWYSKIRQKEKGRKFENRYASLQYKYLADDVEGLSESKNDTEEIPNKLKWIAFKDQFFSSILIAEEAFTSTKLESNVENEDSPYLKNYRSEMIVAFDPLGERNSNFRFYFGPNKFKILNDYDKGLKGYDKLKLQKLVPLGWGIFGWVSRILIIPMFNFFGNYISNYGIIILLMTIVIKLVLFPFTIKSYMSTAKMRVLKPQVDEINARIPADKPMERQKATQELYRKADVSIMGGCWPTLLQMPILFAMFSFFPASIELRQESFLWAKDLSSFDPIISWDAYIPLITPYFGNHISLFCLLMTIANLFSTHINMANTAGSQQMPGMKTMMYIMPVMFLFMFNDYASGLSYYYLISTLITIGQTYLMRLFVNEEELLKKLHEKAKNHKPAKKSGFMARLEEAQKKQLELQKQQAKNKRR